MTIQREQRDTWTVLGPIDTMLDELRRCFTLHASALAIRITVETDRPNDWRIIVDTTRVIEEP